MRFPGRLVSVVVLGLTVVCGCETSPRGESASPGSDSGARPSSAKPPRSLLGRPLVGTPPGDRNKLEQALADARTQWNMNPNDPDRLIWVGRRLGYLWRFEEAIALYTDGIRQHPDYAPLYRHRGHRYITLRRFDDAIHDLRRAADLVRGQPDVIEPDGMPNAQNIPLTTLKFNIWYHLGVAYYLKGDFDAALHAFRETVRYTRNIDDNTVAVADWMYLTLMRLDRKREAAQQLERITDDMRIIENSAYHRRLMMYKGAVAPDDVLRPNSDEIAVATLGYGVGMFHLLHGDSQRAQAVFERVVSGGSWPAFGFIAAEAELARMRR